MLVARVRLGKWGPGPSRGSESVETGAPDLDLVSRGRPSLVVETVLRPGQTSLLPCQGRAV